MKIPKESLPTIKPKTITIIQKILKKYKRKAEIIDLGSGSQPDILLKLGKDFSFNYLALDKDKKKLALFKKKKSEITQKYCNTVTMSKYKNLINTNLKMVYKNIIFFAN